jgi:hypothetical protein
MFSPAAALDCLLWNLRMMRKNPRLYMSLIMGFLIAFLLTEKILGLTREFNTDLQLFEPFIWCFSDGDSILFSSLALILLLSQMPRLDTPAAYLIFRTGRISWLVGQALTTLVVSLGYTLFLFLSTLGLSASSAFIANRWSNTATLLSFAPDAFEVALSVVRKTVKLTTPYFCTVQIFLLLTQYALMLSLVNLAIALRWGKRADMAVLLTLSLIAYLTTPDRFMLWLQLPDNLRYMANLWASWLSPLQHASYIMHNFGYDALPTLAQTHLLFSGCSLGLGALCLMGTLEIPFTFVAGGNHG